ncbi:MAG: ABC transporter ATP-binding protein [Eubacteriales bacterium]|nr:ABC transporter ATP-binding protein [Eubacteriales bacterium]
MLKVKSINAFYGDIQILHNVSLEVGKGEIVTLLGSNGAGKTTTIKAICNLNPAKSGEILFLDKHIEKTPSYKFPHLGISLVPEGRHLFPDMSVKDNLLMGAYGQNDKSAINSALEEVYDIFPRLKERSSQQAGTLSGGEQQMCAIGRGLMIHPMLMILDEPSLGLAPVIVDKIFDALKLLQTRDNVTFLLIEQNAQLALECSNRAYVMENGSIVIEGKAEEMLSSKEVQKAYLGL